MAAFAFRGTYGTGGNSKRDLIAGTIVSELFRGFFGPTRFWGPSGDSFIDEIAEEFFDTTGASATGGQGLLSADSQFLGAGYEITATITGATSFLIGDNTGADADRIIAAQSTYTAGTRKAIPIGAWPGAVYQGASADNVKLTWTGTGTAGRVRVWVARRKFKSWVSS